MRTCSVDECAGKHLAHGMCRAHYLRLYKHGRLHLEVPRGSALQRILAKVAVNETDCWLYEGCLTTNGYGHVRDGRRMLLAHRVTYVDKYGPVHDGAELDHKCRNRACCNPDHLEPVTHAENCRRGIAGVNSRSLGRNAFGQFLAKEKGLI